MATSANLSSIIRYYAEKQKSPFIDQREFCTWIKKYAEHHVEEQAELVKYLGDPTGTVTAELAGLEQKHLAAVIPNGNKKMIISIAYFSVKYTAVYKELIKNESIPYPVETDLPKKFPSTILERKSAQEYFIQNMNEEPSKSQNLYVVVFPRDLPALLLPACVPIKILVESSQMKIRKVLKKEEYHDYFLKKLRSANPSKEISVKNFYSAFVDKDYNGYIDVTDGDQYYLWNQLCYFVRQDFEKIQDRTADDTSLLQAISISEIHSSYLKEKFQTDRKREEALKELQSNLANPPYFFSTPQILKFQDKHGKLLFGQYSEEDLKDTLLKLSTESEDNTLPKLVVFKVASGTRYYIYKNKVISLTVRLCNEAHDTIKEMLTSIGETDVDGLFSVIDKRALMKELNLPEAMSEMQVQKTVKSIAKENKTEYQCFIGAGSYKRFIPAAVSQISSRFEFNTAYTPYQPEISQGTLQVIYEFQSMICDITGMEVCNASVYDAGTACAEAVRMSVRISGKDKILVSECINPEYMQVIETYAHAGDINIEYVSSDCISESSLKRYSSCISKYIFSKVIGKDFRKLIKFSCISLLL